MGFRLTPEQIQRRMKLKSFSSAGPVFQDPTYAAEEQTKKLEAENSFKKSLQQETLQQTQGLNLDPKTKKLLESVGGDLSKAKEILNLTKLSTESDKFQPLLETIRLLKDIPAPKNFLDIPVTGGKNFIDYYTGENPEVKTYETNLDTFKSAISRGLAGEKGATTEGDISRVSAYLPSAYTDTSDRRVSALVKALKDMEYASRKYYADDPVIKQLLGKRYNEVVEARKRQGF